MTESMAAEWEKWLELEKSNIEVVEERIEELNYKYENTANFQYREFWDRANEIPDLIDNLTPLPPDDRQRLLEAHQTICNRMKKKQQREWQARKEQSDQNRQLIEQKMEQARELAESAPEDIKIISKAQRFLKEAHTLLKNNGDRSVPETDNNPPATVLLREDRQACWEKWHQLNDAIHNSRLTIWNRNYDKLKPEAEAAYAEATEGNPHQALEKVKKAQQNMKGKALNRTHQEEIRSLLNNAWTTAIYKVNEIREEKQKKYEDWLGRMEGQLQEIVEQFEQNQNSIIKLQEEVDQYKEAIQSIRSREYGDKFREEIAKKREKIKELGVVNRQLEGKIETLKSRLEEQSNESSPSRPARRTPATRQEPVAAESPQPVNGDSDTSSQEVTNMKIQWLGHASFLITADDGTRIITDPYGTFDGLNYDPINESADIVIATHKHGDHYGGGVLGNPEEITSPGTISVKDIEFKGIATYHDESEGQERGENVVFCFTVDGIRCCHLGDLGHILSDEQVSQIGQVDILMTPVGGYFTIDAGQATQVCEQINPKIVIPMHVRNDKCAFPISDVNDFIRDKANVQNVGKSEMEISREGLPATTTVLVFDHAR